MSGGRGAGPPQMRHTNAILGSLREGGFSVEMTHHAFHVLDIYVLGFALGTVTFPFPEKDLGKVAEAFLARVPAIDYPYLGEHIQYHLDAGVLSEGDFEFGLDIRVDSLDRFRETA